MLGGTQGGTIVVYVILVVVIVSVILPFLHELAKSFSYPTEVAAARVSLWPRKFTFGNYYFYYRKFLTELVRAFGVTIYITVFGTAWSVLVTSLVAFSISRKKEEFRLGPLITGLAVFSIIFQPPIIPYFLTIKAYGLMDTLWAIILPHTIIAYHLIILRTFFRTIPQDLYDATRIDGGSDARMFWQITMPLSKAALAVISIFTAVILWNIFLHPLLFIRDVRKQPLQLFIRSIFEGIGDWSQSSLVKRDIFSDSESIKSALVLITTLPIAAIYVFLQKYFVKGMMLGAIKE